MAQRGKEGEISTLEYEVGTARGNGDVYGLIEGSVATIKLLCGRGVLLLHGGKGGGYVCDNMGSSREEGGGGVRRVASCSEGRLFSHTALVKRGEKKRKGDA